MTSIRSRLISMTLAALTFNAVAAGAQTQSDIDLIAGWSSRQTLSHNLTIDGKVAELFGLSEGADVECFGVGFTNHQGVRVFFCPITNRPERLFVWKVDTYTMFYLTKNGDLDKIVFLDTSGTYMEKKKDKAYLMNNDSDYRKGYELLLNFFLEKAKGPSDRNPSPSKK